VAFGEALEGVMDKLERTTGKYLYVVKLKNDSWCCGFTDEVILPMEVRERISKEYNSVMDGYITLDSFYQEELKTMGARDFARNYKTSIELAMKSRITFHKKPV